MDSNTALQLDRYSRYIPAAISIKHLLDHGKTANQLGSFLFLKKEIPTRLANMIKELQLLPSDLKKQKECTQILNDYISSFREVLDLKEEKGDDQLNNFTQILNNIRRRHLDTVIPYFLVNKNNINTLFPRCPKWQRRYSKCKQ